MAEIQFKHLSEDEIVAAREFLKSIPRPKKIEFDVPLKVQTIQPIGKEDESFKKMWEYLTAKKIDMVLHYDDKIMIVEVKKKLSASAAGQLLLYRDLYIEQFKPQKPLELWHVAVFGDSAVVMLLEKLKIKWWYMYETI